MKKICVFSLLAVASMLLLAGTAAAAAAAASAASTGAVGGSALSFLDQGLLRGNLGTVVGLGIALFGLYMWIIKQETWGIIVILGGILITFFPGFFDGVSAGLKNAVQSATGASSIAAGTAAQTGSN